MHERRLTWHVGSVLPYASLWHTVLRVCALNALHPGDLPCGAARQTATVALLENRADGIHLAALARSLGEAPEAFRWSTFVALPPWLQAALVVPRLRLCFACLAEGYHAALFSVSLLDTCPIHGTPLVERCHCGALFRPTLHSAADYGMAGSCRCGRLHFFTRETCRRPTLAPAMTRVLDPLAAWLQALSGLIRPALVEAALRQGAPGSVEWLAATASKLGLAYPACLRPLSFPSTHVPTTLCVSPPSAAVRPPRVAHADAGAWSWQAAPAVSVYRALARHVRRHQAPYENYWVARFMASGDPLAIGEMVRCRHPAWQAFVAMLWARAVEPGVEQRRWPDRRSPTGMVAQLAEVVQAGCLVRGAESANVMARRWLASHAARVALGAVWRDAQARAIEAARSGIAEWDNAWLDTSWDECAWLARMTPDGLRLVAPTMADWPCAAPQLGKAARRAAHQAWKQARRDRVACRGAYLTWSPEAGWHVIEAVAPADDDLRRRRLLGLPGGRPWCWLYRSTDGRFVARWEQARLQVLAATPDAAIAGLRCCALDYRRVCKAELPVVRTVPVVVPEPMDARVVADYRRFVSLLQRKNGFWRAAGELANAAHAYREALVRVSRPEPRS